MVGTQELGFELHLRSVAKESTELQAVLRWMATQIRQSPSATVRLIVSEDLIDATLGFRGDESQRSSWRAMKSDQVGGALAWANLRAATRARLDSCRTKSMIRSELRGT